MSIDSRVLLSAGSNLRKLPPGSPLAAGMELARARRQVGRLCTLPDSRCAIER